MINILKRIFKFFSSVRLAIPLMIIIIAVVAYGTIVESLYNADMSKLKVYQTPWFSVLMIVLWVNILFAALSRWPWKKNHLGFLITHLGLLTLLGGGMMTSLFGLDGTLRVMEGQEEGIVVLPDLVLGVALPNARDYVYYPIDRSFGSRSQSSFHSLNQTLSQVLQIDQYLPFTESHSVFIGSDKKGEGPLTLNFRIKSAFFDVEQWLQSETQKSLAMGPAEFVLEEINSIPQKKSPQKELNLSSKPKIKGQWLVIKKKSSGQELKRIEIKQKILGSSFDISGVQILLTKIFSQASVGPNGIEENPNGSPNPALEINITQGDRAARDVVFAKFPGFSINQKVDFDLAFEYEAPIDMKTSEEDPSSRAPSETGMGGGPSNKVVFQFDRKNPDEIRLKLSKAGATVLEQKLKVGETVTTPWMGIQVTLKEAQWNALKKEDVVAVEPMKKANFLPPSALLLTPALGAPESQIWLTEGDEKSIMVDDKPYGVYFGRKIESLPFKLKLKTFKKIDYPGTSMAKSYESLVNVSDLGKEVLISMNEPLEHHGYTIYQSSFEELPQGGYASIFSINKDPGRPVKYLGSIILCFGIIIFTLMRSRWYIELERKFKQRSSV